MILARKMVKTTIKEIIYANAFSKCACGIKFHRFYRNSNITREISNTICSAITRIVSARASNRISRRVPGAIFGGIAGRVPSCALWY